MQMCTQTTQSESQDTVQAELFVSKASVEAEDELEFVDGSPLRNALREYLKSYNGVTESRKRVTV